MDIKPIETRTCECCGSVIGTYRFTVTVEFYQEVDVGATCPEEAVRKLRHSMEEMPIPPQQQWFGGDLRAYDMDGDQVAGD